MASSQMPRKRDGDLVGVDQHDALAEYDMVGAHDEPSPTEVGEQAVLGAEVALDGADHAAVGDHQHVTAWCVAMDVSQRTHDSADDEIVWLVSVCRPVRAIWANDARCRVG